MSKPASASDGTQGKATHKPRHVPQVMVSSTFTDLHEHRQALIGLLNYYKLHPNVMEYDSAGFDDVIDSSLNMVRDSAAYILIVGPKYGQTPSCPERNPDKLSITELEFNEAARLGRPTLLFVMGEDHPVKQKDVEKEPEKITKLNAFRERAKQIKPDSDVHRVYSVFNSLGEFKDEIAGSIAKLQKILEPQNPEASQPSPAPPPQQTYRGRVIPAPPVFYAEPDYIGSHTFVGREAQLQELNDWAKAADPTNLLLYEAIGGNGKSMLTWEWATKHAMAVRSDWAGRFWYSFYERGAVMADFCRRALAYMTGRPMEELEKMKTLELGDDLLACLHERPWLLILDGLERVLVAYHRIDAAEVPDEEANAPTDKILNRNPCDAIREEDSDLLRRLAAASPSKILVSSRLTPRALLNLSGQAIPGAKRLALPGLRPADAEQLLRSCGITGNSEKIQEYLTQNCDNYPLVIGVLAGLIANYLPDRGNFDTWVADASPQGGAFLNLAKLDLSQRRNDILSAAFEALPDKSRQLLSTLALISSSVDYKTLSAFNPHIPCEPNEEKLREASGKLPETVKDLEQRGLLQFDGHTRRYDLHPVVRGVAAGTMKTEETTRCGQHVIDHFSSLPHQPYEQAQTIEDVATALQVVRTLLKLGRFQDAADAYSGGLSDALLFNLEAYAETLSLLRPLFPSGWDKVPENLDTWSGSFLVNIVAMALDDLGEHETALTAYSASLIFELGREDWRKAHVRLSNIAVCLMSQNQLAMMHRINMLNHDLAVTIENKEVLFRSLFSLFFYQSLFGQWSEAATTWQTLDPMGRSWRREVYRQGEAEYWFAVNQFWQGKLQEVHLSTTEQLARKDGNRAILRYIYLLRGEWRLEQREWALAAESFHEALSMARERGLADAESETGLALAKFHLGLFHSTDEARHEAERLSALREPAHQYLAMLWRDIGDLAQAEKHALAAYKWAWADGEPYVRRYELDKATELLREMNFPIPNLPPYDPAKDEPFPWEADVRKAIEKLRAEKAAKKTAEET
jgi:tetratricopeptide (TPR) repeat protein